MAGEIVKYEAKVKKLLYTCQYSNTSSFKIRPKKIKVTSSSIVINGEGMIDNKGAISTNKNMYESVVSTWDVTIPMADIVNMHNESFKAEGAMHYHKDAVGIDAKIDGLIMSYAIFTDHAHDLFKIIQSSRPL